AGGGGGEGGGRQGGGGRGGARPRGGGILLRLRQCISSARNQAHYDNDQSRPPMLHLNTSSVTLSPRYTRTFTVPSSAVVAVFTMGGVGAGGGGATRGAAAVALTLDGSSIPRPIASTAPPPPVT